MKKRYVFILVLILILGFVVYNDINMEDLRSLFNRSNESGDLVETPKPGEGDDIITEPEPEPGQNLNLLK